MNVHIVIILVNVLWNIFLLGRGFKDFIIGGVFNPHCELLQEIFLGLVCRTEMSYFLNLFFNSNQILDLVEIQGIKF